MDPLSQAPPQPPPAQAFIPTAPPAIAEMLQEAPAVSASAPLRRLRIVVTQPTKEGEGVNAHVLWQVSATDLDTSRHSSVRRRYSDWLFLRGELNHHQPGSILPTMPGKNPLMGKPGIAPAMDDMMESRRAGLQEFLTGVAQHARLGRLGVLQQFLEATDAEWAQCHAEAEARNGSGGTLAGSAHSMIRWVRDTTQGWKNSYTDTGRAMVGETDPSFEVTKLYVDTLQHQLVNLHERIGGLASTARESGFAQNALADELRGLAQTERAHSGESATGGASPPVGGAAGVGALALTLEHTADACARLAAATGPAISSLTDVGDTVNRGHTSTTTPTPPAPPLQLESQGCFLRGRLRQQSWQRAPSPSRRR